MHCEDDRTQAELALRDASMRLRQAQIKLVTVFLEDTPQIALAIMYINSQKDASGAGGLNLPNEVWYSMAGSIFNFCLAFTRFFKSRGKRNEASKLCNLSNEDAELTAAYCRVREHIR